MRKFAILACTALFAGSLAACSVSNCTVTVNTAELAADAGGLCGVSGRMIVQAQANNAAI